MPDDSVSEQGYLEVLRLAEKALNSGEPTFGTVDGLRVIGVPDIVEIAGHAHGRGDLPETWCIRRIDGRTVKFFDGSSPIVDHKFAGG